MIKTRPVKGTQDCLDTRLERKVEQMLVNKIMASNFSKIRTPLLEHLDLFVRCVGQDTDVVGKEMFLIESEGTDKICLRPEATASTVRAFLDSDLQSGPWKVFSYGPMFRHERPQKGRWRQFDQLNLEIIDAKDGEHDVMLIELLNRIFSQDFGLDGYTLHINFLGYPEERAAHRQEMIKFLETVQESLCDKCVARTQTNPLRCFDCKGPGCQQALEGAPLLDKFLTPESRQEWARIQELLTLMSVDFVLDPRLVRGLDYYQGVVFEFKSNLLGAQDTFCGGGRYDLAPAFGHKKELPSVGAAVGTGRLMLLLEESGQVPDHADEPLHLVIPVEPEQRLVAMMAAAKLSDAGLRSDVLLSTSSVGNMMKKASKMQAAKVLIIGPEEQESNTVVVKDMASGEQVAVSQGELASKLKF